MAKLTPVWASLLIALLSSTSSRAATVQIVMDQLEFRPAQSAARVGDSIEWINKDVVAHTATARDGSWEIVIPAGQTKRVPAEKAGNFAYYCRFHPNMTGLLKIQ